MKLATLISHFLKVVAFHDSPIWKFCIYFFQNLVFSLVYFKQNILMFRFSKSHWKNQWSKLILLNQYFFIFCSDFEVFMQHVIDGRLKDVMNSFQTYFLEKSYDFDVRFTFLNSSAFLILRILNIFINFLCQLFFQLQ